MPEFHIEDPLTSEQMILLESLPNAGDGEGFEFLPEDLLALTRSGLAMTEGNHFDGWRVWKTSAGIKIVATLTELLTAPTQDRGES